MQQFIVILWSSATGVSAQINYELAVKLCLLPTHVLMILLRPGHMCNIKQLEGIIK